MMKFSDLEKLFQDYDQAKCICGNTKFTFDFCQDESWDAANEVILKMVQFCNLYGIKYDGML